MGIAFLPLSAINIGISKVYELVFWGMERRPALDLNGLAIQNTASFMAFGTKTSYENVAHLLEWEQVDARVSSYR